MLKSESSDGTKTDKTYDYICFSDVVYECDSSDFKKVEKKIKRRLKYYSLAAYDQERVAYIRVLKDELCREISLQSKSKYYSKSESKYADLSDFDISKMTSDYLETFTKINESDMAQILKFAIYIYYLR
ncbi:hypothetical protein M8845_14780 [Gelidibacter japonicus]|jgi:hypothetical protein|uniref:hypothetical protein n=1 Tax=Gelidibacter japonicus TaxID=1962232 RepID=UPI0020210309|nr:hypothetical protein [Gelidibacter japonicus]MCL8008691.1 hypothetical protein [Gelidibacter japonicus]